MLIKKDNIELNRLLKAPLFRILVFNAILVLVAYGLNTYTDSASQVFMFRIKTAILIISFLYTLYKLKRNSKHKVYSINRIVIVFALGLIISSLFSSDVSISLLSASKFLFPFIYIYLSIKILADNFTVETLLKGFCIAFALIYSIPVIVFLLSGGGISNINIYSISNEATNSFASNHYGWSSILFLVSGFIVLSVMSPTRLFKLFILLISLVSIYLLIISANRTSWLALTLVVTYLFFRKSNIKPIYKYAILLSTTFIVIYLLNIENSAINFVLNKNLRQTEEGEPRLLVAKYMLSIFNSDFSLWFTGVGFYDHSLLRGRSLLSSYHNSYLEVLFGCGIPLFLIFLYLSFIRPVYIIFKNYSSLFPVVIPILLIPYFESNFTAGQFLFFPWFILVCIAGINIKKNMKISALRQNN